MAGPGEVRIDGRRGLAQVGERSVAIELLRDGTLRVGGPAGPRLRRLLFAEREQLVSTASRSRDPHASLRHLLAEACLVERGAAGHSPVEPALLHALCLHLSGAGVPAPDFARVAALIVQATGWSREQIDRRPADEIDGLAMQIARPHGAAHGAAHGAHAGAAPGMAPDVGAGPPSTVLRDADGWTRVVLAQADSAAPSSGAALANGPSGADAGSHAASRAEGAGAVAGAPPADAVEALVERLVAELLRRVAPDSPAGASADDVAADDGPRAHRSRGPLADEAQSRRPAVASQRERGAADAHSDGGSDEGEGEHGSPRSAAATDASRGPSRAPTAAAPPPRPSSARGLTLRAAALLPRSDSLPEPPLAMSRSLFDAPIAAGEASGVPDRVAPPFSAAGPGSRAAAARLRASHSRAVATGARDALAGLAGHALSGAGAGTNEETSPRTTGATSGASAARLANSDGPRLGSDSEASLREGAGASGLAAAAPAHGLSRSGRAAHGALPPGSRTSPVMAWGATAAAPPAAERATDGALQAGGGLRLLASIGSRESLHAAESFADSADAADALARVLHAECDRRGLLP